MIHREHVWLVKAHPPVDSSKSWRAAPRPKIIFRKGGVRIF